MPFKISFIKPLVLFAFLFLFLSCMNKTGAQLEEEKSLHPDFNNSPLVSDIFTADPSAHIFENRIYIYASHDIESGGIEDDSGNHFNMID